MGSIVSRTSRKVHIDDAADWASYYDDEGNQAWANLRSGELTYEPHHCEWAVDHEGNWYNKNTGYFAPVATPVSVQDMPRVRHFPAAQFTDVQHFETLPPIGQPMPMADVVA
tara:strand:+ start:2117 stop:2452 length:336 start_codon:yes stop_codon:yes gene_type:complete